MTHVTHVADTVPGGVRLPPQWCAGFRVIGERRNSGYWLGQPANETLMDAVPEDFTGPSAVRQLVDPGQ